MNKDDLTLEENVTGIPPLNENTKSRKKFSQVENNSQQQDEHLDLLDESKVILLHYFFSL